MSNIRNKSHKTKSHKKKSHKKKSHKKKYWSADITTNAVQLEPGVFTLSSPRKIALSLRRSVLSSNSQYPYRSAMSMLSFYINRAGTNLTPARIHILNAAKDELRQLFGREEN